MIRVLLAALLLLPDLSFALGAKTTPHGAQHGSLPRAAASLPTSIILPSVQLGAQIPALQIPQAPVLAIDAVQAIATEAQQQPANLPVELGRRYDASAPGQGPAPVVPGGEGSGSAPLAPSSADKSSLRGAGSLPTPPKEAKRPFFIRHYKLARAILWPFLKVLYRVDGKGLENLPAGRALIVPNHVSYVDAIILSFAANRPMRFMLYRGIYDKMPGLFNALGAIPVAGGDDKGKTEMALARARAAIEDGQTVVIFPEGGLTRNGNMTGFRKGFERIAEGLDVPVVPAHLDNLWGSFFSRKGVSIFAALSDVPRRIGVRFGKPLEKADAQLAREAVQELSTGALEDRVRREQDTLPRMFLRAAKGAWKRRALADSTGKDLTFGKSLAASIVLSQALEKLVGASKSVGVLVPPSAGGALANIALSIGGRVPINFNYTASAEAVEHAAKTAGVDVVVTSKKAVEGLKAKGAAVPDRPMIYLEDVLGAVPKWKLAAIYVLTRFLPLRAVEGLFFGKASSSLDDTATVVFTSGSTSLPKGVELTHLNLLANMQMVEDTYPFGKNEVVLGVLPFFHSFGFTMTLWFSLTRGLAAAYHSHPLEFGPIQRLAEKYKATLLLATPTFLQRYSQKIEPEAFGNLRNVIAGAEKLRPAVAQEFEKTFGVMPLEGYGSTELSPVAAVGVPEALGQKGSKESSVGQNLPGSAVRVVDPETFTPVKYGEQGLLLVKGPHVMKGYMGQPEKTAEVIKDGWYVTGDVAIVDREGFIFLKGRWGTRFSKIAGEMVPHEAVEERLHKAADLVEQTFVVSAVPDERRGERLVVLHTGWPGDVAALLDAAKKQGLPGIWTPSKDSFYKVDSFPLLGSGKLDLKALKELALKVAGAGDAP